MAKADIRKWIFGTSAWHIFRWYVLALSLVLLGATWYFHWIVVSPRHFMQTIYVAKVEDTRVEISYPRYMEIEATVRADQIVKAGTPARYALRVMVFEGEWKGSWLMTAWNLVGRGTKARIHAFSLAVPVGEVITPGATLTPHQRLALAIDQGLVRGVIRVRPTACWASRSRENPDSSVPFVDVFMEGDLVSFEPVL